MMTLQIVFFPSLLRVSAGTAHGFALFDYIQKKAVMSKCTLNPNGKQLFKYF